MGDFKLPVLEGEGRRQVIEGLRKCIEAYPELREYADELHHQEGRWQALATVARQFKRKVGRPFTDAERQTLGARYKREGVERVVDPVLDLTVDELGVRLRDPNERPTTRE